MEFYIRKCTQINPYAIHAFFKVTDNYSSTIAYLKVRIDCRTVGVYPDIITILDPYKDEIGSIKAGHTLYLNNKYVERIDSYHDGPQYTGGSIFIHALKFAIKHPVDHYYFCERRWELDGDEMHRKDGSLACAAEFNPSEFLQKAYIKFKCDKDDLYLALLFVCFKWYNFFIVTT